MKKKILASIFVFVLTLTALTATVFAERKRELPVNMEGKPYSYSTYKLTLKSFDILKVENIADKKINKLHYKLEYKEITDYADLYMEMKCYDKNSIHIATKEINPYMTYIEVPENTAKIEIVMDNPTSNSDSYYYSKYMEVYSADGRTKTISELLLPVYEKVGWTGPVKMYSLDGRTKYVKPSKVAANEAVGWYTEEALEYKKIQNSYNEYKTAGDYNSIIKLVEDNFSKLAGTEYEDDLYAIRTEAMDLWRNATGAPLGVINYKLGENSIGTPEVTINFRNISYKKIVAYKIRFTCYNVFGNIEESYYDYFYDDDANIAPAKTGGATWTLYGADSVHTVKNIRVTEVVFEDGTKWKR